MSKNERSSKDGGWFVPKPEEPWEMQFHWFDRPQPPPLSAPAKTAIYVMDVVTAMTNRMIRWLDKGLGGPQ